MKSKAIFSRNITGINFSSFMVKILLIGLFAIFLHYGDSIADTIELPQTGQETSYTTGDDGDLQIGVSWPKPRFTDNRDGTITDNLTGLMWLKDANCFGEMIWQDSFDTIDDFSNNPGSFDCSNYIASYTDWRLPNINELESLANFEESDPEEWLENQGFINVQPNRYHSSTTSMEDTDEALIVRMSHGDVFDDDKFNDDDYVWPVRFGNGGKIELPQTGQKTSFITDDDGDLKKGVSWPDPRFIDNADGTITDNLTDLMWLKDASCFGEMTWQDSFDTIDDFSNNSGSFNCSDYTAFYNDWRLPNRKELFSLIDHSQYNPTLSAGHPFLNVQASWYWSSTTLSNTEKAWFVHMRDGHVTFHGKTNTKTVWPVRSEHDKPDNSSGDKPDDQANLIINFFPDPVPKSRGSLSSWRLEVSVKEINNVDVFIDELEIIFPSGDVLTVDDNEFQELFNDCGNQPNGLIPGDDTACSKIRVKSSESGEILFTFFGTDENGNDIEESGSVLLKDSKLGSCITWLIVLLRDDLNFEQNIISEYNEAEEEIEYSENDERLAIIRNFRDDVLLKSITGLGLVELYYRHSPYLIKIILDDPVLKSRVTNVLEELIPIIKDITSEDSIDDIIKYSIPSQIKQELSRLLEDISLYADDELKEVIRTAQTLLSD